MDNGTGFVYPRFYNDIKFLTYKELITLENVEIHYFWHDGTGSYWFSFADIYHALGYTGCLGVRVLSCALIPDEQWAWSNINFTGGKYTIILTPWAVRKFLYSFSKKQKYRVAKAAFLEFFNKHFPVETQHINIPVIPAKSIHEFARDIHGIETEETPGFWTRLWRAFFPKKQVQA